MYMLAVLDQNAALALVTIARPQQAANGVDDTRVWLEIVFWIYISPIAVGLLYRLRSANRLVYRVFALVGTVIVLSVAAAFAGYEGAFTFVLIPTAVAAIPNIEDYP